MEEVGTILLLGLMVLPFACATTWIMTAELHHDGTAGLEAHPLHYYVYDATGDRVCVDGYRVPGVVECAAVAVLVRDPDVDASNATVGCGTRATCETVG